MAGVFLRILFLLCERCSSDAIPDEGCYDDARMVSSDDGVYLQVADDDDDEGFNYSWRAMRAMRC